MVQKPPLFVAGADQSRNYRGLISRRGIKLEIRDRARRGTRENVREASAKGRVKRGMPETFAPRADSGDDSVENNVTV